jgi:putative inorganic carbon (HCO3(-)) transporter
MDHQAATSTVSVKRPGVREELLVVAVAVSLTIAASVNLIVLSMVLAAAVLFLASIRFKPLLLVVIFFLPFTLYLNWDFPIKDLGTLVRLCLFAGMLISHLIYKESIRKWLFSGRLTWAILGYLFVATLSATVFNRVTLDAERELMRLASYVCFYYAVAGWIKTEEEFIALFKTLMVSTIAVALFGFYQFLIGDYSALYGALYPTQEEILKVPPWSGRITSFLSHYNALAGYLNLIIPFCIGFALRAHDWMLRTLSRWCLGFACMALLLTQSRGGLLACAAILILSAHFFAPSRKVRMQRMAIASICVVLAALLAGLVFERLSQIDDYTTVSRLAIWSGATNVFAGSPLTGMGFGNLRSFMGGLVGLPAGWVGDAHNLYLELLAETGILGFLAFAFLVVASLRMALAQRRLFQRDVDKVIGFAAFASICGVLVHGTVDYLFHTTPQATALFLMVLGIVKANERRQSAA